MEKSRTKNTIRNVSSGFIVQIINKVLAFVVRTVFINTLNKDYLGVNGLFTNILTILSFAELGIGTAIIYNMYKPVSENDYEKIKSYSLFYKKAYSIIGIVVFGIGLMIIPFLKYIIKDIPDIKENLNLIYVLFLANTSLSYFFTYKKSIISAYQQESQINKINSFCYFFKSMFEIIILSLTHNYILYLLIDIIFTIMSNILSAFQADKMFPYLKDKDVKKLEKKEISDIYNNVKSLTVYKFGSVIMNGTDNIIISAMINVTTVGLCSNYNLIINSVRSVIATAINGITASVGNLNIEENSSKKESVFYQLTFVDFWIYCFCAITLIVLVNPFIELWLGKDFVLNIGVIISLAVSFFIDGLRTASYTFRVTSGMFKKGKITPYLGSIVNIAISIILCKFIGVIGIFIGTSIAQLSSYSWIDPYLLHKYEFKSSFKKYLKYFLKYFLIFIIDCSICYGLCLFHISNSIMEFLLKICIVSILSNLIIIIMTHNTIEFISLKDRMLRLFKEKFC